MQFYCVIWNTYFFSINVLWVSKKSCHKNHICDKSCTSDKKDHLSHSFWIIPMVYKKWCANHQLTQTIPTKDMKKIIF